MRFNYEAYDKLFPREEKVTEEIETVVDGFTPTKDDITETGDSDGNGKPSNNDNE